MARDKRYVAVKALIENGRIKMFQEIFEFIPKTVVAADLGKHNVRFSKMIGRVEKFTNEELFLLAGFIQIPNEKIIELMMNQYNHRRVKKKVVTDVKKAR
ncbi:MAG: hypothetical protein P0Y53_01030 [Candidatus Pseudobacter hemicellulosilyticus]|uniref:Uncharacterized protein n=1 Tax=Candidatus Pseudobacter hemicellulosilyticus TaxID=3121375 RepID=A0AAJ5WSQ2_9BACT|nr:MAG: hypothetical protein P0Y53_01030 [Pseudobacter sp.]